MAEVTTRLPGKIPGCVEAHQTPSLCEQQGINPFGSSDLFIAQMRKDIEDSKRHRIGPKHKLVQAV